MKMLHEKDIYPKHSASTENCINYYPKGSLFVAEGESIQIPLQSTEALKTPSDHVTAAYEETFEIMQETAKELQDEIEALKDALKDEKEESANWKRQYYEQIERGDAWRNKNQDAERQIEKLKELLGVEAANRKYAETKMDEALVISYRDEQLTVELMRKFVQVADRTKGEYTA